MRPQRPRSALARGRKSRTRGALRAGAARQPAQAAAPAAPAARPPRPPLASRPPTACSSASP
eukprot:1130454-Prymnesium_polylepis.1